MYLKRICFSCLIGLLAAAPASAEDEALRREIAELKARERKMEERMQRLEELLRKEPSPGTSGDSALDDALERARNERADASRSPSTVAPAGDEKINRPRDFAKPALAQGTGLPGAGLIDISFSPIIALGGSTANEEELETLQGGEHDPKRRGFTLQQAELSLGGAVDPYFYAEGHFIFSEEEGAETEEVFFQTSSLPYGLELEGGLFLTEFGLLNPSHAHAWDFVDQPVINTRLFGADGQRGTGVRLSQLIPVPWAMEIHVGMQQADGEKMPSFRGAPIGEGHGTEEHGAGGDEHVEGEVEFDGIGGRPRQDIAVESLADFVYLARADNFFDLSDTTGLKWGISGLVGPNTTGENANTYVYGSDLLIKWTPDDSFRGYPYVKWQSEVMGRAYEADSFVSEAGELLAAEETLDDWGFYSQILWGFSYGWSTGARAEWAGGSGESLEAGRDTDPFRSDRLRLSPLLAYRPTEFSRIRLQYNYDDADYLEGGSEHAVWMSFDMLIGKHPVHRYGQN